MNIISHRGYWKAPFEKNTLAAFERSFQLGFGTETDIRDHLGRLVISHDMPTGDEMLLEDFLALHATYRSAENPLFLALNIKSDGLADALHAHTSAYSDLAYAVFDMSVPDMRGYLRAQIPTLTRASEVETDPVWLEKSNGIWLDHFEGKLWYTQEKLAAWLETHEVYVVSPELHKREPEPLWEQLIPFKHHPRLTLCTDRPEEAACFFQS